MSSSVGRPCKVGDAFLGFLINFICLSPCVIKLMPIFIINKEEGGRIDY